MPKDKASVAVALIAKNSAKTIAACLDSVVPYVQEVVVCVDASTTDNTAKVAKKHGAKVYTGLKVSEVHECPEHGKVMAQHFAKARQASFAKLRTDVDWHMWLDADDILKGGDRLVEMLANTPSEVAGFWLPYHYAQVADDGPTTTLFDRERIVRTSLPWQWQHRVHEILAPVGMPTEAVNWARPEGISVWHQGKGHDTAGSAKRNILLLEIELEDNPNDMRSWHYLGNQYFALQAWGKAAECFERATATENPYQLWQTYIYLSMAYEKLGNIDEMMGAAFHAASVIPGHPEPYYRLATAYMMMGDADKCEFWTKFGDSLPDAPYFVFKNPLDKTYNARLTLATAYANAGKTSAAKRQLEFAAKVVPSQSILEGIEYHKRLEEESLDADAVVRILQRIPEQWRYKALNSNLLGSENITGMRIPVPPNIWRFGRVRDVVVPGMISKRGCARPRIIFFCGRSVEPWAPPSVNTTGIGGSETAVIQIAKRFAQDGWWVDVYNDCDRFEGVYDEVGYWDCKRLERGERADVLVSWRNPAAIDLPLNRRVSVLWMHDLNKGGGARETLARWEKVMGVSNWHADYLRQVYGLGNTGFVPNGIDLDRFANKITRVPFRCVYASSPDRGLDRLLQLWPRIVENEPAAELHVAYGFETIDKTIAMGYQPLAAYKDYLVSLIAKTPNVVWRGRLPQDELAKLYGEAYALLYPTDFLEVSCIVAMEAMAAGCPVVASGAGALPETIGDGGLVVKGNVYTRAWRDYYTHIAKGVLHSPDIRNEYAQKGRERAGQLTWDRSFSEHWEPMLEGLLEGEKPRELVTA